jgi:hypothetical protein
LVLGSADGQIRMFNTPKKINMDAKTALPGLGGTVFAIKRVHMNVVLLYSEATVFVFFYTKKN